MKVILAQTGCQSKEHVTNFVVLLITLFVNIGAKRMLEGSEHRLYRMIRSQKQEIVNEKVLRCAVEFARDGLPASSNAPPEHHSDYNAIPADVLGQPIAPESQQTSGSVSSELDGFSSLAFSLTTKSAEVLEKRNSARLRHTFKLSLSPSHTRARTHKQKKK